jgi:plasmid stabilization system protein ParE
MSEIVILSGAENDLDEIYSRLAEGSTGERFLQAADRRLELLRTFPEMAPPALLEKIRKVKIGSTPYGLFMLLSRRIMVIAVQDLRQDPASIAKIIRRRL